MRETLKELGLKKGDSVLVHTDLRVLKPPKFVKSKEEILQYTFDEIMATIGEEGTLLVPAYFYEYAREGLPFDVNSSKVSSSLGLFSQFVTNLEKAERSCNPLQSVSAIGKNSKKLVGDLSLSGFGVTSPWHKLREMGGKILFLGAPLQSMTFVHYIEQLYGVPHLYFKIYPYPVTKEGKRVPGDPISAVRYLEYGVEYDLSLYEKRLREAKVLSELPHLKLVDAEEAFAVGIKGLSETPYFFLKAAPKFILGQKPTDTL